MAKIMATKSATLITLADTNENELEFLSGVVIQEKIQQLYVRVVSGTIKFSVYTPIGSDTDVVSLGPDQDILVTICNGKRNLKFKGSIGNSFIATI